MDCFYCASDMRICTPALVLVVGALDEMYGITFRWSKYNLMFILLFKK